MPISILCRSITTSPPTKKYPPDYSQVFFAYAPPYTYTDLLKSLD